MFPFPGQRAGGGGGGCPNQTSRSLKKEHFCTGDSQLTNKRVRGTSKKQLRKIAENLQTLRPPPQKKHTQLFRNFPTIIRNWI